MKLNDIKFLQKANAFSDVYTKATGMPFVGEMMVAAAGQESEPTPDPDPEPTPTEFTVSNVRAVEYDCGSWTIQADANMDATGYTVYVQGNNGAFEYHLMPDEEDPTKLVENDEYDNNFNYPTDGGDYTGWYREEGVEAEYFIQGTYTVVPMQSGCVDCESEWEERGYSSYWDCECNENDHCVDCENDWESEGFENYEDCDCQVNGNCGEEEPAPFEITDMTVMVGEGGYGTIAGTTNASTDYSINVTIMDTTGELVWFTSDMEINPDDPRLFYGDDNGDIDPNVTVPSFGSDVGNYTAVISDGNGGEWTVTGTYSYWDE